MSIRASAGPVVLASGAAAQGPQMPRAPGAPTSLHVHVSSVYTKAQSLQICYKSSPIVENKWQI
jgi:hypothetical protein